VLTLVLFAACNKEVKLPKPNVVFIIADDLGYHDLGITGSQYYETPNIDRIGREGMRFTNGYATCQVCSPSRASVMSGQFPARHGITDWIGAPSGEDWRRYNRYTQLLPPEYKRHLPHEFISLPEALKEAGYLTFMAGKWHLGTEGSYPEDHGFDVNKGGFESGSPRGGYFSPYKNPKLEDGEPGENLSIRLAMETAEFIKAYRDTSFFVYLAFYAVHGPIQTSQEKWSKYRDKAEEMGIADSGYIMERRLPIRQEQDNPIYAGLLESMDVAIGMVLDCLEENGLNENTIVVFTSDNGGVSSGDNFSTSNLPLRGGKGYQWEGGIKEPFFMKVPWMDLAGKECDVPVTGADFYPTLLELAGAPQRPEQHKDGVSLVPLLEGRTLTDRPLYWHYPHYGNQGGDPSSIIREGEWKLIQYWEDDTRELYNLENDPGENQDVAGENPDLAEAMNRRLLSWLEEVGANYPYPDPEYAVEQYQQWEEQISSRLLPELEKNRMDYLNSIWQPNADWWGSQITKD